MASPNQRYIPFVLLLPAIAKISFDTIQIPPHRLNFVIKTTIPSLAVQAFGFKNELPLYRIVQELVQNVVKHALASEVLVQLYSREAAISITVDDDGTGIADPEKAEAGLGLKSIRSRLKVMGGEMDIRSVEPHGTAVHIEVRI